MADEITDIPSIDDLPNVDETSEFTDVVKLLDIQTPILGYDGTDIGPSNWQAQALANRTKWLKEQIDTASTYAATGAVNKFTPSDRARRKLSTVDFGNSSSDIGTAANSVISSLATEYSTSSAISIRGGEFELPRGSYPLLTGISIEGHSSGISSISISGQGQQTSELDLSGASSTVSAIVAGANGPVFGVLRDFSIKNAPNRAINLDKYSRMTFKNIQAESGKSDGYYFGRSYVSIMEKLTASNNAGTGVNFNAGLKHSSHHINSGYAIGNTGTGWYFGYMNYSVATAVAADGNAGYGYVVENSDTFILNGCGSESSGLSGFAVLSSTVKGPTKNVVINNAYASKNGRIGTEYPNLLYVLAQDETAAQVRISKSLSINRSGDTMPDIIADGVGAEVEIDDCTLPNGWLARNGGYIHWRHKTLVVRNLSISASTARSICSLKSTQGHTQFSGTLTVLASDSSPDTSGRNTAIYHLLVSKSTLTNYEVIEIAKAGQTTGDTASAPSFKFSISSDRLAVTPIGSTAGNFWFEIDSASQVVAVPL